MNRSRVFGFVGYSGSGKTTLIEKLIPILTDGGMSVSLVKHAHHDFDIDQPGKDSHRHRMAGCSEVLVGSSRRWALIHELRNEMEPSLADLTRRLSPCDIVLVEGFKRYALPKLEVWRSGNVVPFLFPTDAHIVGVASDAPVSSTLPSFMLGEISRIANFVVEQAICASKLI